MKQVVRRALSEQTLAHLRERQALVDGESDFGASVRLAEKLWNKTKNKAEEAAFKEIRQVLLAMCNAPRRCMYCEDSEAWDVEHLKPKSRYPEHAFSWQNYVLACSTCNSRFKGAQYHDDFMDPAAEGFDLWQRWIFDSISGYYFPVAEDQGAAETLRILGFDERRAHLAENRRKHLRRLVVGIDAYGAARDQGRKGNARSLVRAFSQDFPAVTEWVLIQDPDECPGIEIVREVKQRYPEIVDDVFDR